MKRCHPARDPRVISIVLLVPILLPLLSFLLKVEVTLTKAPLHIPPLAPVLIIWLTGFVLFGAKFFANRLSIS